MSLIRKVNKFISININPFQLKREEQDILLNRFKEPRDLIERSYFQFSIQFSIQKWFKRLFNNFIALFMLPFILLKAILGNKRCKVTTTINCAVFPYKNLNYDNILPLELKKEFDVIEINFNSGIAIKLEDVKLILRLLLRYPFQPYFVVKCVYKILFYRYILEVFNPIAIISSCEYSFTSSILTHYCKLNGVEHINVMHGEKLFFIRDSFFEFSRFYIWDWFYADLFKKLRACNDQFIVGTYPSLDLNIDKTKEKKYLFTYYLAAESKDVLLKIRDILLLLCVPEKINIRFHPRYSNAKEITSIFGEFHIEDSRKVSLKDSFESTSSVISLYSSVLVQAYFSQVEIIVDNLSNLQSFNNLRDLDYIVFSKHYNLLSNVIKSNE